MAEVTSPVFNGGQMFRTPENVTLDRDLFLVTPPNNSTAKYVVLQNGFSVSVTFVSAGAGNNDYLMHVSDQPGDDYVAMQAGLTSGPSWNGAAATAYQYGYPINPNSGSWGANWQILAGPEVPVTTSIATQDRLKVTTNLRKALRQRSRPRTLSIQPQADSPGMVL